MVFFFDVVNPHNREIPQGSYGIIQFRTTYTDSLGNKYVRISTVAHSWTNQQDKSVLLAGFDQEATAALVARLAVYKAITDDTQPIRWIDRVLIQLMHQFSKFRKDSVESFQLPDQLTLFPEFMFHLRRGNLIQIFGNSPDETTYFRHYLLRESVGNCLTMIQPSLDAYGFNTEEPQPVLLSTDSLKPDRILLLDTFFHVVVYSGETIATWRRQGFQDQPGHENFKLLLQSPVDDATALLSKRFPLPLHVVVNEGGSQGRFLLAVLDPGKAAGAGGGGGANPLFVPNMTGNADAAALAAAKSQVLHTDDVPLHMFMEHLKKKVVSFEG